MDIHSKFLVHPTVKVKSSKRLRQVLAAALVGGSLVAVPHVARAATHIFDDPQTTPQSVTLDADPVVTVNTTDDFSVSSTIAGQNALDIQGNGNITYDDLGNGNNLSSTVDNGLSVFSWSDAGATPGSVTINSSGDIYGGGMYGVEAQNNGSGDISITTSGTVTGNLNSGIWTAVNNGNLSTGSISIKALGDVSGDNAQGGASGLHDGQGYGITATNNNTWLADAITAVNIYTEGNVEGGSSGIYAWAESGNIKIETNGTVTGGPTGTGIDARSIGSGAVDITANNEVTTGGWAAINVESLTALTGGGVTVTAAGNVTNTDYGFGIAVRNNHTANLGDPAGTSFTTIHTTGSVQGGDSGGIVAWNDDGILGQTDINITAEGGVSGGNSGVTAENYGQGTSNITINTVGGAVTATGGNGIYALNWSSSGTGDVTVTTDSVSGTAHGIWASNAGSGDTTVTANGNVNGGMPDLTGDYDGIYARSVGGNVTVEAKGNVIGDDHGIHTITDNTASNNSLSSKVIVDGTVAGHVVGIFQLGETNMNTTVKEGAVVKTVDIGGVDWAPEVASTKHAISLDNSNPGLHNMIANNGTVIGNILGGMGPSDALYNMSIWNNAGGVSDLRGGNDVFTNQSSASYIAANQVGAVDTYLWNTEYVYDYGGDFVMQNMDSRVGGSEAFVGDRIFFPQSTFIADRGHLLVDTSLVSGISDELHVDTIATAYGMPTWVDVNMVDGLGSPTTPFNGGDGILVVDSNGSSPNGFALENELKGGLYEYQLNLVNNQDWYLQSNFRVEAMAANALTVLGSRSALSSLSNLHDRQRDVETLADNSESRKGVWGRVFGQKNDFEAGDVNGIGFNSDLWGVQAGLDFVAKGDIDGKRKYAGLYLAYADSNGDATQFGQKVGDLEMNATSLGLYYTKYSASHWYLDLVAQYSRLGGVHLRTAGEDLSPSGNSYALSLEAGKQFNPQGSVIGEVQAQLIDQYTDMDDVSLSDGSRFGLSSVNAVTGRFGVRFYGNPREEGKSFLPWMRANIWHTFSGASTVSSLGNSLSTPMGGTSGELELGFSKGRAESGGWGFYGSAGYLFDLGGAEYSGWKGTLGMRKGW